MVVVLESEAAPRCKRSTSPAASALAALKALTVAVIVCMMLGACSDGDRDNTPNASTATPPAAAPDNSNSRANSFNANAFNSNDAATLPANVANASPASPAAPASGTGTALSDAASTPLVPPVIHTVD